MKVSKLSLEGVLLLEPTIFRDERGFFLERYRNSRYKELGIASDFSQDNHSYSSQGTLRGLHFQSGEGQDKLISVISGTIFDVAVDIRLDSPTFGKWLGVILEDQKMEQLFIPKGFAHGFCVLSREAHVVYKVSPDYDPKKEMGFVWNDAEVGIDWPIDTPLLSEKDRLAPSFAKTFAKRKKVC